MAQKELNSMQASIIPKFYTLNTKQSTNSYYSEREHSNKSRFVSTETFVIIWLDPNITLSNKDIENLIDYLQCIVNSVKIFTDIDQSIDYLSEMINEKVLMIVSGSIGQYIIPLIYEFNQLVSIYIFCENKSKHELWTSKINKIKGIFTQIEELCDKLRIDIQYLENNFIPITVISPSSINNLNQLDCSFMYSQSLIEIILENQLNKQENEKKEFIDFCRINYLENKLELKLIDEFDRNYPLPSPIWWYTRPCFLYEIINKALRTQNIEVILKIGFCIRDIHRCIEQLYSHVDHQQSLIVYRGQGMFQNEFDKIQRSKGGLLAFNNFLSTSIDRQVSYAFAESASQDPQLIGILFQINIDPSQVTTPFASLDNVSFVKDQEKEVLFSMHSVFRIGEMKSIEDRLFEINLTITNDNDEQLQQLKQYMRKETEKATGLERLGSLMMQMGQFDKAEKIYNTLYEIVSHDNDQKELATIYNQLGIISCEKHDLTNALSFYQKSLDIELTYLSPDDFHLSSTYSNIGLTLLELGDLDEALKYLNYALHIDLHTPQANQINIALRYNNIGGVLQAQGKYSQALESFNHALEIFLTHHLPLYHPWTTSTHNNICLIIHEKMEDKSSVLPYLEKTLQIKERSLPSNHPSLAITHGNLACLLDDLHQTPQAIEHAEKALNICLCTFPSHHHYVQQYQQYLHGLRQKMELDSVVNSDDSLTVKLFSHSLPK
jgi:tetratricopeptide (TPR) repeat protein